MTLVKKLFNPDHMTNNSELYKFSDFTLINYKKLINIAKKNNYSFSSFEPSFPGNEKLILWRHDVEFSPFIALKMAIIEAEEGEKATYFFQLHSEFYNILEKEISEIVDKIKLLGHDIGLHFDPHFFNIEKEAELEKHLELDKQYFNAIFDTNIKVFSFHNTNKFILSCENHQYAGLINVYSKYFKSDFSYCTDSTGFWRYERLEEVLNDPGITKLQVLTHDAMWNDNVLSPRQRVLTSVEANMERVKKFYDQALSKVGVKNVDWDKVYE